MVIPAQAGIQAEARLDSWTPAFAGVTRTKLFAIACVLFGVGLAAFAAVPAWSPEELTGRQIYRTGKSPGGKPILAQQGEGGAEFPASLMTCASCHGQDGRGRPEGGVEPSNITWGELTKPYGLTHAGGRKHGPYDEKSVLLAIALGLDPAGNELSNVMPRYQLSREDGKALVAYLKRLAEDRDPGIAEDRLTLGTVLPADPTQARLVETQLTRTVEKWNGQGGFFGRQVRLVALSAPVTAATLGNFLDTEAPFALLAPHLAAAEAELVPVIEAKGVPAVGAVAAEPLLSFPLAKSVFYTYTGVSGQLKVLARWAARDSKGAWALLAPASGSGHELVAEIEEDLRNLELPPPRRWLYSRGALNGDQVVAELVAAKTGAVVLVGGGDEARLVLDAATRQQARFALLAPAAWAGGQVVGRSQGFTGRLVLAYPALPSDTRPAGLTELEALGGEVGRTGGKAQTVALLAASKLLYEALTRAGRDLSRQSVISILEKLYEHDTYLTRPLTFGPNRRVGSWGAYLVEISAQTGEPVGGSWFDLE